MKKFLQNFQVKSFWFFLVLISILAFGVFLRLWNLENTPPGLQIKEASNGLEAIEAFKNKSYQLFYSENKNESLLINFSAIAFNFLNIDSFSVRLSSAIIGILTLLGFYFLLKELRFSRLSILMGVFILATSFWHLNFSRISHSAILVPFFLIWLFYFFSKSVKTNNKYFFLLSGIFLGTGFYSHFSFKIAPLILIFLISFLIFSKTNFLKKYWLGFLIFVTSALVILIPLFLDYYQNPQDLIEKNPYSAIFNTPKADLLEVLAKNTLTYINSFYFYGDPNQQNNHAGSPLIPPAWAVFFAIGFAFSIKNIFLHLLYYREKDFLDPLFQISLLAQGIFWVMLLPGILSIQDAPSALKIIGVIPAIIFFIIIPFEYILRLRENLKKSVNFPLKPWRWRMLNASLGGLIVIIFLTGLMEIYTYHFVWGKEIKTYEAFETKFFDLGKLIKQTTLKSNNILVIPNNIQLNGSENSILKIIKFAGYPEIKEFQLEHPAEALKKMTDCKNSKYIFLEADKKILTQFQTNCLNFEIKKEKSADGYYDFWTLKN